MRGIATGDTHLCFRAFPATIDGRNARETDVERAWSNAIDYVVAQQPDIFTISGDCFHHPRPSMHSVIAFRDGIRRVAEETPAHVLVIQGNHDAGRTAEVLTPIAVAVGYGRVRVVTEPKRVKLHIERTGESLSVACFPFTARSDGATYLLEPDPTADLNMLLMHAAVKGGTEGNQLPHFYAGERALDIAREADQWDVCHVGDFHEFQRLHPTALAFYAGALERTSSNIWQEHAPKGVVAYDTEAGTMEFQEVPTRPMHDYDLGDFDMPPGIGARELCDVLEELSTYDHLDGAIVRLKVDAFVREERGEIDWKLVREIKKTCLHFELDLRFSKREVAALGDRRERGETGLSLSHELAAFTEGMDDEVRKMMAGYMGVELAEEVVA